MASLGLPSVSVSVHNGRSNTSAAAELAEFRKITKFEGKTTLINEHPVVNASHPADRSSTGGSYEPIKTFYL